MTENIKICAGCLYKEEGDARGAGQLSREICGQCGQIGHVYVFPINPDLTNQE